MSGSGFSPMEISYRNARLSEADDMYLKVVDAIQDDDADEFVDCIREPALRELLPPSEVADFGLFILSYPAVECAEAVLLERTEEVLGPDFGFPPHGWTALHVASSFVHEPMLKTLLDSRLFSPDLRADSPNVNQISSLKQALPLNFALRYFRFQIRWNPEPSAFTLLNFFYTLEDGPMDAVRLLALNTKDFHQEFFNYAKQGKMPELAALLMAAGDKLLPLCVSEGEFYTFKQLSHFLQHNNGWSLTTTNDDQYAEWKETLKLLDVYDNICHQITAYVGLKNNRRCGMEVATLLQAQGIDVVTGIHNLKNYAKWIDDKNLQNYVKNTIYNYEVERSKALQSSMEKEKAEGFDARIDDNNLQHYVHVDRSKDSSLDPHVHGEFGKLFPKENIYSSNWTNQESRQPSMPIVHASCSPSLVRNMSSTSASRTPPTKSLNAVQNLISNKRLSSFVRMLTRGVRYV